MLQASPPSPLTSVTTYCCAAGGVRRYTPLALWHLLSLDAPSVAAVWMFAAARSAGISLPITELWAMFVAVWMLYAADRLLDAAPLHGRAQGSVLEARHHFHHRHRKSFLAALTVAAVTLPVLLAHISATELWLFSGLGALLACWLLLVHGLPGERAQGLPKEFSVGVFFPAAVFLPAFVRSQDSRTTLALNALCFAAVCTLNCVFLYAWEHSLEPVGPRVHVSTWAVLRRLKLATGVAFLFAAMLCVRAYAEAWASRNDGEGALLPAAMLVSIALLWVLHLNRDHVERTTLRALADAALLTPLPMLMARMWHRPLW